VLTTGLDRLLPGQGFGVGTLAGFARDQHITIKALPVAERWFGLVAITYRVTAQTPATSLTALAASAVAGLFLIMVGSSAPATPNRRRLAEGSST
jgi:hypothetical protein